MNFKKEVIQKNFYHFSSFTLLINFCSNTKKGFLLKKGKHVMKNVKKLCIIALIASFLIIITRFTAVSSGTHNKSVHAEISYGELIDKITILRIKMQKITDEKKLHNVKRELTSLQTICNTSIGNREDVLELQAQLQKVNETLWNTEDAIRAKEHNKDFNEEFIVLARTVYMTNDKRCHIKRKINDLLSSAIVEEKSYEKYTSLI
jgi:hypothetical protein